MSFQMVERFEGLATDLSDWIVKVREAGGWLVLREFAGIVVDSPARPEDQLPSMVPGVAVESVAVLTSDKAEFGFPFVELTVWGRGSMQVLRVDLDEPVVAFAVMDGDR